jgi:hypothetical protein
MREMRGGRGGLAGWATYRDLAQNRKKGRKVSPFINIFILSKLFE